MWCAYILRSMSHPDQEDVRAIGNRASDGRLTTRANRPSIQACALGTPLPFRVPRREDRLAHFEPE